MTRDGGASWRLIVDGLPNQPVNAVRQDPVEARLLYAATENGVEVSFDAGAHWQSLQLNLPHTSARDVIVHGNDLIVATHGRGFWILDDVEPLRELALRQAQGDTVMATHLFAPALTYRVRRSTNPDTPLPPEEPTGQNPPDGAIVDYSLASTAARVIITIYDSAGREVRKYASDDPVPAPIPNLDKPAYWERPSVRPPASIGMHRFVWDLREPSPHALQQDLPISAVPHDTPRTPQGPLVVPGRYTARLDVDGKTFAQTFTVAMDPRVTISPAALREQHRVAAELAALMDSSFAGAAAAKAARDEKRAAAFSRTNGEAATLLDIVDGADAQPTAQALEAVRALEGAKAPSP